MAATSGAPRSAYVPIGYVRSGGTDATPTYRRIDTEADIAAAACTTGLLTPARGAELYYSIGGSFLTIACALHARLSPAAITRIVNGGGAHATRAAVARHPKLRASVVDCPPGLQRGVYFRIHPTLTPASLGRMFKLMRGGSSWQAVVAHRINVDFQRYDAATQSLFQFVLLLESDPPPHDDDSSPNAHIILFADHCVADGMSSNIVLNDWLNEAVQFVPHDAAGAVPAAQPEPLRAPAFEQLLGRNGGGWLARTTGAMLLPVAISAVMSAYKAYRPLMPIHDGVPDLKALPFPRSTSFAIFTTGTRDALTAALAKCRSEGVTLYGALVASVVLAHRMNGYKPAEPAGCLGGGAPERVTVALDADFNLRPRLQPPLGHTNVAFDIGIVTLDRMGRGIPLDDKFWDVARALKADTQSKLSGFEAALVHRYFDAAYDTVASIVPSFGGLRGGCVSDVNFSSLGAWPFPTRYVAADDPDVHVQLLSQHLINSCSSIANATMIFITSCNGVPGYSIIYKTAHLPTQRFFRDLVACWDGIASISAHETIRDAAARLCRFDTDDATLTSVAPVFVDALPLELPTDPWAELDATTSVPAGVTTSAVSASVRPDSE